MIQEEEGPRGKFYNGELYVLPLAWLGEHRRASAMLLAMCEDQRVKDQPTHPGRFGHFMIPALTMGILLCIGREKEDDEGSAKGESRGERMVRVFFSKSRDPGAMCGDGGRF